MGTVGQKERQTQARIINLLQQQLDYNYLGNWIDRALHQLDKTTALGEGKSLYDANRAVYELLRYGVATHILSNKLRRSNMRITYSSWHPAQHIHPLAQQMNVSFQLSQRTHCKNKSATEASSCGAVLKNALQTTHRRLR